MKKLITPIFALLLLFPCHVFAGAGFFSYGGESIVQLADLPDTEEYQTPDGEYADIGYIYKSVSVFYVPIWNYDGRLVMMLSGQDSYIDIGADQIEMFALQAGVTLPPAPYLDFWQRIGGKLTFIVGVILFGLKLRNKSLKQGAYLSPLPTASERLQDILITGQEFTELDIYALKDKKGQAYISGLDENKDESGQSPIPGLDFVAAKTYLTSFITVSIFDMAKLSVTDAEAVVDNYFPQAVTLKKATSSKASSAIHYMYFVFTESPSADEVKLLLKLKKKKIMKGANGVPAVIDLEKEQVHLPAGAHPNKKVVEKCFIQQEIEAEPAAQ